MLCLAVFIAAPIFLSFRILMIMYFLIVALVTSLVFVYFATRCQFAILICLLNLCVGHFFRKRNCTRFIFLKILVFCFLIRLRLCCSRVLTTITNLWSHSFCRCLVLWFMYEDDFVCFSFVWKCQILISYNVYAFRNFRRGQKIGIRLGLEFSFSRRVYIVTFWTTSVVLFFDLAILWLAHRPLATPYFNVVGLSLHAGGFLVYVHIPQHWDRGVRGGWMRLTAQRFHPLSQMWLLHTMVDQLYTYGDHKVTKK